MKFATLLPSFQRCRFIEIRPAMASMPMDRKVWNAPRIQRAALLYICLKTLNRYNSKVLLQYYKRKLYSTMERTYILYKRHFWVEMRPLDKFPSIFILLTVDIALFVQMSYAILPTWKLHFCSDINSELYKPTFHGGHLSCNTFYDGAATLQIFCLPWQRYSYSTWSSMTELFLLVSQH